MQRFRVQMFDGTGRKIAGFGVSRLVDVLTLIELEIRDFGNPHGIARVDVDEFGAFILRRNIQCV